MVVFLLVETKMCRWYSSFGKGNKGELLLEKKSMVKWSKVDLQNWQGIRIHRYMKKAKAIFCVCVCGFFFFFFFFFFLHMVGSMTVSSKQHKAIRIHPYCICWCLILIANNDLRSIFTFLRKIIAVAFCTITCFTIQLKFPTRIYD